MKLRFLFIVQFAASCLIVSAQNKDNYGGTRAQSIFGELGGNGGLFSVNYDTRFSKRNNGLGARAGIGFVPGFSFAFGLVSVSSIVTFPVGLNYLIGKGPHYLDAGAGATFFTGAINSFGSESTNASGVYFVPSIGYRYQPFTKGFTGRVVISPQIGGSAARFWAGLSAGFRF